MNIVTGKHRWLTALAGLLIILSGSGCEKFVTVGPPRTEISTQSVFQSDESAISAMRGIYSLIMSSAASFANGEIDKCAGLSADELTTLTLEIDQRSFYTNKLIATNNTLYLAFWKEAYRYINNANMLLENLPGSTKLSEDTRKQLEGEAKFLRAFCHFYLANLFGDVPYVATSDYKINAVAGRTSLSSVYAKIIEDLQSAKSLMKEDYSFSGGNRTEPNKWAASALLARVYLYQKDWASAEQEASLLIGNTGLFSLVPDLDSVFLAGSTEAIWALQPVIPDQPGRTAQIFVLVAPPPDAPSSVTISNQLFNSFETGDLRKSSWIGQLNSGGVTYNYAHKYKLLSGTTDVQYPIVLRLAEQYLVRAEARIQLNRVAEGVADLNVLRDRAANKTLPVGDPGRLAPLPTTLSPSNALLAVEHERQIEFFAEWGHRWLDLKRTGRANAVLASVKGTNWTPDAVLYPIPQAERLANPNLSQNKGY